MAPPRLASTGSSALGFTGSSKTIGFGGIDTNSHDEVLMLLVKVNLCMTAVALGVLLFLLGGKLRRWRSSKADRRLINFSHGEGGSFESVFKKTSGSTRWRGWRDRLAASARQFSKQAKKERELEKELSDFEASPMSAAASAANRPASVTHFHWSPAPPRTAATAASPPSPPPSPTVEAVQLQHQHQQYQPQQHQSWQLQRQRATQQRRQQQFSTPGTDTVTTSSSSSGGSVLSLGAASAASSAALLTCRCLNADLRLHNTPASSEFSLPAVGELQVSGQSLQPPPTPQTPISGESVITDSSC